MVSEDSTASGPPPSLPPNVQVVEEPAIHFRQIMISQLEQLSASPVLTDEARAELGLIPDDVAEPEQVETALDIILVTPGMEDMLQFAIGTLTRDTMMPIEVRGGLTQVAVDTACLDSCDGAGAGQLGGPSVDGGVYGRPHRCLRYRRAGSQHARARVSIRVER
eukprot:1789001-Rhodomonas_salina.4